MYRIISILLVISIVMLASPTVINGYYNAPPLPPSPRYRYRPLIAGLQIAVPLNETHEVLGSISFPAYWALPMPFGGYIIFYGIVSVGHIFTEAGNTTAYQNTSAYQNNYIGNVMFLTANDGVDASFTPIYVKVCPFNDVSMCLWPPSRLLPRVWLNHTYGGQNTIYYSFIGRAYESDITELINNPCLKVGRTTYTTYGTIVGYMVAGRRDVNGETKTIYVLITTCPSKPGDSGSFLGWFYTSMGVELYGIVFGVSGGYSLAVFHNITSIWAVEPIICPNPYTCPC